MSTTLTLTPLDDRGREILDRLERRDFDRLSGILVVRRTVSSGEVVELTKTTRSRREVPLTAAAHAALDALAPRLDTGLLFSAPGGGLVNLDNFRRREWAPAVAAAAIATPRGSMTFAARSRRARSRRVPRSSSWRGLMGTSIEMIERHYGTLLDGSAAGFAERLDAFEHGARAGVLGGREHNHGDREHH